MSDSPTCRNLIILTVVVFLAQIFVTRPATQADLARYSDDIFFDKKFAPDAARIAEYLRRAPRVSLTQRWLELDTDKVVFQGQLWRLVTTAFCHDRLGLWHIVINMLFLYWFGPTLESLYGSRELLIFYLTAAVVASLAFVGLQLVTGERIPAIGASGAVMAVVCLFTIFHPRHRMLLFFVVPIEMRFLLGLYVIYDVHPLLLRLSGTEMSTGIAHAAHLGGLAFGYLYWRTGWRLESTWNRISYEVTRRFGRRRHLTIHRPIDDRDESELDQVLAKISEQGQDSLTDSERQILMQASHRFRDRNKE